MSNSLWNSFICWCPQINLTESLLKAHAYQILMMRISFDHINRVISFPVLVWFNRCNKLSLIDIPDNYLLEICTNQFFTLHPCIRLAVLPQDRVNITFMLLLSKSQFGLQWFLIEVFGCLWHLRNIKHIEIINPFFNWVWPACKHIFIVWRGSYSPYLWISIIKLKDSFLVDSIGVLWKVDQMNFILSLKAIRAQYESMVLCVCHHRTHASALITMFG